ncbi:hypothetical protein HAX54_024977 [Datura stramonium]|uniref:Uncharacterized protein n=1 Tax=Datura stramonium TaxID=4076 RepID=A0ABS8V0C8_DATST|nr:hypothetical protein [Datura stramonium]
MAAGSIGLDMEKMEGFDFRWLCVGPARREEGKGGRRRFACSWLDKKWRESGSEVVGGILGGDGFCFAGEDDRGRETVAGSGEEKEEGDRLTGSYGGDGVRRCGWSGRLPAEKWSEREKGRRKEGGAGFNGEGVVAAGGFGVVAVGFPARRKREEGDGEEVRLEERGVGGG